MEGIISEAITAAEYRKLPRYNLCRYPAYMIKQEVFEAILYVLGITHTDLCTALHVSRSRFQLVLRGRRLISLLEVNAIRNYIQDEMGVNLPKDMIARMVLE